jgi:hypothetical protein
VLFANYYSGDKSNRKYGGGGGREGGHEVCSTHREEKRYRVLVVKPAGRRPHGTRLLRWQDNLKVILKKSVGWRGRG